MRTRSQELDYPRGDQNVYSRYEGRGGIPITSWLRRLAFAARFGEPKIVLSDDLTAESRILMYRDDRASASSGSRRSSASTAIRTSSSTMTGGWCG